MRRRAGHLILLTGLALMAAQSAVYAATQGPYLTGLRRLTESQYRNSIADIFGPTIVVQGKFEKDGNVLNVVGKRFKELEVKRLEHRARSFR